MSFSTVHKKNIFTVHSEGVNAMIGNCKMCVVHTKTSISNWKNRKCERKIMHTNIISCKWSITIVQMKAVNYNNAYNSCHLQCFAHNSYLSFDAILRFLSSGLGASNDGFVSRSVHPSVVNN